MPPMLSSPMRLLMASPLHDAHYIAVSPFISAAMPLIAPSFFRFLFSP